jgi:hypothetical protein
MVDSASTTALGALSKTPGPIGMIGTVLNGANLIGGTMMQNKFKKDLGDRSQALDETNAFGGLTNLQNVNMNDTNTGQTLIGGLLNSKKKKGMIAAQEQLRQKGKTVNGLLNFNKSRKSDALSSTESLGQ